jgi:hypothetical protein
MKRFTQKIEGKDAIHLKELIIENDYAYGDAIDRLAKFESFYDEIEKVQLEISIQLEVLRNEGKEKTVEFKELFTKKLVNNNVMAFLRFHGLSDKK